MRPREDELIDPEIAEQLDAIDATLAGEPVAPRFAELAELALLLSAGRPEGPAPEFAEELDRRVQARFGRGGRAAASAGGGAPPGGPAVASTGGARWRRWGMMPALGGVVTAVAAVVAVALVATGGGSSTRLRDASPRVFNAFSSATTPQSLSAPSVAARPGALAKNSSSAATTPHAQSAAPRAGPARQENPASSAGSGGSASINGSIIQSPAPIPNGRKIIQSSMLTLGARARRIDAVAQEIFVVVSAVNGIVDSSNVSSSGGPGASAQFRLRVPSSLLSQALTDLSRLRYASVISRTDNTQDVNGSYLSTKRQVAGATAALARLQAKLAAAIAAGAATEIASLRVQIAYEKATLAQAQASLGSLNRRIDFSNLDVSVQATTGVGVPPSSGRGGGFGLGKAGHDAIRVLEVTAGVALIALAALVPLALLVALVWWLALAVQRRRRERALDMA
jgi:hypothetical protein